MLKQKSEEIKLKAGLGNINLIISQHLVQSPSVPEYRVINSEDNLKDLFAIYKIC